MPYIKFTEQEKVLANSTSIADYLTMQGEAVKSLLGEGSGAELKREVREPKAEERIPFVLPEKNADMRRVYGYLIHERCIDRGVLNHFIKNGLIYEDAKHHNAVFVGVNSDGIPVHAHKRATFTKFGLQGQCRRQSCRIQLSLQR